MALKYHPNTKYSCFNIKHGPHYMVETFCTACNRKLSSSEYYNRCDCSACGQTPCIVCAEEEKQPKFTDEELSKAVNLRSKTLEDIPGNLF